MESVSYYTGNVSPLFGHYYSNNYFTAMRTHTALRFEETAKKSRGPARCGSRNMITSGVVFCPTFWRRKPYGVRFGAAVIFPTMRFCDLKSVYHIYIYMSEVL